MQLQDSSYKIWLSEIKQRIRSAQIKAALKVNAELIHLYWELGREILEREKAAEWGDKWLHQLSRDLTIEFPDMKGFSHTNLKYIRRWYQFYNSLIGQQLVAQLPDFLSNIPWGHHLHIITKCKDGEEALFYVKETAEHGWSRNVLVHQIESGLFQRKGAAVTNFKATLPAPQSDLARELLKDPYKFDFLNLGEEYKEKDLEDALVQHITKFLLELGAGFSYVGRQYHLEVGGEDFYLDLLFYHLRLRCFVVIELKTGKFIPEYAGKLNFYLNVVDDVLRHASDHPSIGILICKERNKVMAEYALRGINKPIGITEYQLTQAIPEDLKGKLPTIQEIEEELSGLQEED
ncbi:PDDEXK nuclease domain-containing protein [Paraflavisolibacter sp. H34]|uniref:PDDEXK nuclease domain-containing protein n=1 Tax=Huijunlia imazamoxiresistens TaxID=3127457 RepID=UPI003016F864